MWYTCRSFNCKYSKAASLAENLAFLREMLQDLGRGHKVAVFVLDEFDLFAKRAKQTTLYNLLDALQSAGMQVTGSVGKRLPSCIPHPPLQASVTLIQHGWNC